MGVPRVSRSPPASSHPEGSSALGRPPTRFPARFWVSHFEFRRFRSEVSKLGSRVSCFLLFSADFEPHSSNLQRMRSGNFTQEVAHRVGHRPASLHRFRQIRIQRENGQIMKFTTQPDIYWGYSRIRTEIFFESIVFLSTRLCFITTDSCQFSSGRK